MGYPADEISFAFGLSAERGTCALVSMSTITCTMGTGTGSHSRAWAA